MRSFGANISLIRISLRDLDHGKANRVALKRPGFATQPSLLGHSKVLGGRTVCTKPAIFRESRAVQCDAGCISRFPKLQVAQAEKYDEPGNVEQSSWLPD